MFDISFCRPIFFFIYAVKKRFSQNEEKLVKKRLLEKEDFAFVTNRTASGLLHLISNEWIIRGDMMFFVHNYSPNSTMNTF